MYPEIHREVTLYELLHEIDIRAAKECRAARCPRCGGPLHSAVYERKPRGGPEPLPEELNVRLGLCCGRPGCRHRVLPRSSLFLGRRVYWGAVVLVVLALRQQRPDGYSANRLRREYGVSRKTLVRWLAYFREIFPASAGWRRVRGYVVATVLDAELPMSLLASFVARHGGPRAGLIACLGFLAPCWSEP